MENEYGDKWILKKISKSYWLKIIYVIRRDEQRKGSRIDKQQQRL